MTRIPDSVLAQLKQLDLVALIRSSGVELRRVGKNWQGLCPLHPDKEPSLIATPKKGLWQCFGCERGGSTIDWVMALEGLSFREAAERLQREYLPETLEARPPERPKAQTVFESLIPPGCLDEEAEARVVAFYHEQLLGSEKPQAYLRGRGLGEQGLLGHFGLGYANRQLGLHLPLKKIEAGREIRSQLSRLGFLREESGHEHMNGRVVVPILDGEGRLEQMYGRTITPNLRPGTPKHLYLPRPLDCVFHPQGLVESREVILCEAPLDALTFWSAGFRAVTTSFGKNHFPKRLLEAMKAHRTKRVLIAYDNDAASNPKAQELGKRLLSEGIEAYRVWFPKGMDANGYACKVKPAEKSLDLVIRRAEWLGEGPGPSVRVPEGRRARVAVEVPETVSPRLEPQAAPPASEMRSSSPPHPVARSSLVPESPQLAIPCEIREHEVVIPLEDRRYRVRGLERNTTHDVLKVNLLASRGDGFHVDTFDLYSAPKRASYVKQVSLELGLDPAVAKQDIGKVLLRIEELQAEAIEQSLRPKEPVVVIEPDEQEEALRHLESRGLVERTREHLEAVGIVGEGTNKLLLYLVATSRKLWRPLAVLIQSSSAAGKSALVEGVLSLVPEEERVSYSAMTGQSLYYMGERDLRHKVLSIAEGEGMERASYALKLLQSEGKVSIASTGKDPQTGRLRTHEYVVEGPTGIVTTSTQIDLDEEFANRCLVLSVDESREQTEAIHRYQRRAETLEGLRARERRRRLQRLHQNAQRLLRPMAVVTPFAETLRYPSTSTRTRRDHEKYLALIRSIALLHQHQREVGQEEVDGELFPVVEAQLSDVELANELACEVLGRTLEELPPQTQSLLEQIHVQVLRRCGELGVTQREYRLTRREIREVTGWGNTQLKMHLRRLEELEYLLVHRGRRGQSYVYELLWNGEGREGEPFVMGLLDPESLGRYDGKKSGSGEEKSGLGEKKSAPGRGQVGPKSGGGRGGENGGNRLSSKWVTGPPGGFSSTSTVPEVGTDAQVVPVARRSAEAAGES